MIYDVGKYSTRFIVAGKPSLCHRLDRSIVFEIFALNGNVLALTFEGSDIFCDFLD